MEDPRHYCRIVTARQKTMELQHEVDKLYPQVEESVVTVDEEVG